MRVLGGWVMRPFAVILLVMSRDLARKQRLQVLRGQYKKSPDLASEDSILVRDTGFEPVTSSV